MAEMVAVAAEPEEPERQPATATYADVTARGARKPIVAPQWRPENFRATLRQHRGYFGHKAAWHGVRLHLHVPRVLWYAVRGAGRDIAKLHAWVHHKPGYEMMATAVAAGRPAHGDAARYHGEIEKTRARRSKVVLLYSLPVALVLFALIKLDNEALWLLTVLTVVGVFARHGRPHGKPMFDQAVVDARFERLTPDIVVRGLNSLNLSTIDKFIREGGQIAFITPVQRDGPGWRVTFDLPYGVTAAEVISRRDKFASGLRRPAGCVWPQEDAEHPGRMTLYVCDEPLGKMRQPAWPLLKAGQADIFKPLPFGTDQRGRPVSVELIWANLLIGSIPRMGKTVAMRNMLLAAALDVRAELHVWELKGTGDLSALEKAAHAYGSGADDETIEECLADLRKVHAELERRAKVIKGLPREVVPDSKVTPQLASKRTMRLHPLIFAVDECQEAFSHPDLKAEFERLCLAVIRRGPALGIILILATQRPDSKSLPTGIRANAALRFCLKVMDDDSNNMILGEGSYSRGINSTLLAFSDKGVGWAVNFADAPMILKAYNINGPAAARICDRARALREDAGVLTGYAAGDVEQAEPRDTLGDVLRVFQGVGMHWETLAERLDLVIPERWADVTAEAISAQCRTLGVDSVQVKVGGVNRQGCRRLDVEAARAR